jgi:hypothetical protein
LRLLLAEQADPFVDHVELDQPIVARIAHDTQRLAAFLRGLDLPRKSILRIWFIRVLI